MSWMEDVVKLSGGEIIAVDGKTQRRSHDRKRGVKALPMVSAWACGNAVVLGQVKTEEKSNEITAVPELLDKLELSGCIVTLDAMGCQRAIAKQVRKGEGIMLAVKGNQKQLDREVRKHFEAARERDFECEGIENDETAEDGHGRVESRSYYLSTDPGALPCVKKWSGIRAVGRVESERWSDGRVGIEQRYYITSLEDMESFG